jgi:hypothetical protein
LSDLLKEKAVVKKFLAEIFLFEIGNNVVEIAQCKKMLCGKSSSREKSRDKAHTDRRHFEKFNMKTE